jgi:plastocyanin
MRTMPGVGIALTLLVAIGCGSSTTPANSCGSSANANVNATDAKVFSPSQTTITHGQSVCWQNNGAAAHTVTSNDGSFDTSLPSGQIFVHSFPTAGTFPYHCTIHSTMTGTITVN